jgi:hypothetical protein
VADDRIIQIDESWKLVLFPDEHALMSFFGLLQDKAQPSIVALILDAGKSSAPTLEAHPFSLS